MGTLDIKPDGYFEFDFGSGRISYCDGDHHAIIIPLEAIKEFAKIELEEQPHKIFYYLGMCVGKHFGKSVSRLYKDRGMVDEIEPEDFLRNLNAVLSLHGFGLLSMETWGDVLLFEWEPLFRSKLLTSSFQEGLVSGILREFSGMDFETATVENGLRNKCKLLAGNARMIEFARKWVEEGAGTGEIVTRLKNGQHLR